MSKAFICEHITHYKNSNPTDYLKYDAIKFDEFCSNTAYFDSECLPIIDSGRTSLVKWFIEQSNILNKRSIKAGLAFEASLKYSKMRIKFDNNNILNEKLFVYTRISLRNSQGVLAYDDIPISFDGSNYALDESTLHNLYDSLLNRVRINHINHPPINTDCPDIILSPKAASYFIHEIIGHMLEYDYADLAKTNFKNRRQILPTYINIYDDPFNAHGFILGQYDDAGELLRSKKVIENGCINELITTRRCDSFYNKPLYRMSNLFLEGTPNGKDLEYMIKTASPGTLLIHCFDGGGVSPINGEFFLKSSNVDLINSNGNVEKTRNVTIVGNNNNICDKFIMVGKDLKFYLGLCVKEEQVVVVSNGSPSIKLRNLRLF